MLLLAHQLGHKVSESDAPAVVYVMSAHAQIVHYKMRYPTEPQKAH